MYDNKSTSYYSSICINDLLLVYLGTMYHRRTPEYKCLRLVVRSSNLPDTTAVLRSMSACGEVKIGKVLSHAQNRCFQFFYEWAGTTEYFAAAAAAVVYGSQVLRTYSCMYIFCCGDSKKNTK